jgi:hypothetical protein
MAAFSGAVKIGDLNDFIAPSQACVVALQQPAAASVSGRCCAVGAVASVARFSAAMDELAAA